MNALLSHYIKGRFDGKPQSCRFDRAAFTLTFDLDSKEDGRRSFTVRLPKKERIVDARCDRIVVDEIFDTVDEGYYATIRVGPEDEGSYAELRVDNTLRPAFWLSLDVSAIYFE